MDDDDCPLITGIVTSYESIRRDIHTSSRINFLHFVKGQTTMRKIRNKQIKHERLNMLSANDSIETTQRELENIRDAKQILKMFLTYINRRGKYDVGRQFKRWNRGRDRSNRLILERQKKN